ncbi:MAG: tetratricopeptide repeat protein [Candidatus Hydrogenedentes bacterium]|nr:tetratricopeptide repeat protein [Candidatus Hydrogenedentota bacterium]
MAVQTKTQKNAPASAAGKKTVKSLFDDKGKQDDITQLLQDVKERPLVYGGIAAFLLVCLLAGYLYRANAVSNRRDLVTAYAQALDKEETADKLAALVPLSDAAGKQNDEVVYMTGEIAYRAGEYDKAKAAFERMRSDFKESPYTADAVEGLGNIAENAKDYDAALTYYKEVRDSWSTSFAARRQPLNIAKLEERRGNLAEAVAAYREQMQVFPGSTIDEEARAALARLERSNPELFPKIETAAPVAPVVGDAAAPEMPAPGEAPAASPATVPGLDVKLDVPGADGTLEMPADGKPDLKLNVPGIETEAAAPAETAAPADSAPAPAQ